MKTQLLNDEKVDQIRIYSGNKYHLTDEVMAGDICAIKGLKSIVAGQGLGIEDNTTQPLLSPYMDYQIKLPPDCDQHQVLKKLNLLAQEDLPLIKRKQFQQQMQHQLQRIEWLIATLLKLSKIDANAIIFEPVDVVAHTLLEESIEPLLIGMELKTSLVRYSAQRIFILLLIAIGLRKPL